MNAYFKAMGIGFFSSVNVILREQQKHWKENPKSVCLQIIAERKTSY